ncbi:MAG: glycosyltransferase [Anaerolineae bacterium]|nr:glycosyltransferase [Anaerolineae bacterium]
MGIKSIRQYTNAAYELIVVDNASTDGSLDYLQALPDITLVQSPTNWGCPPARAKAMHLAKGEFILWLDNDTIVTSGWLNKFTTHMKEDSAIGVLGPRSNYVPGLQSIGQQAKYKNELELQEFAVEWTNRVITEGDVLTPVQSVVGFCMLIRREVMNKVGVSDAQFGKFGFEDYDFALRAIVAGFKVMIANDVFIHHSSGPQRRGDKEYNQSLQAAWEIFRQKWNLPDQMDQENILPVIPNFDPLKHFVPVPPYEEIEPYIYDRQAVVQAVERYIAEGQHALQMSDVMGAELIWEKLPASISFAHPGVITLLRGMVRAGSRKVTPKYLLELMENAQRREDWFGAIALIKLIMQLVDVDNTTLAELWGLLGDSYWQAGQTTEAVISIEKGLQCDPQNGNLLGKLQIFRSKSKSP